MSGKVKVSRKVAEALRTVLPNGNNSSCIEEHVKGWVYEPKLPLNALSTEEFARCCLVGYEVEQTPEENLLDYFNITSGYDKDLIRTVLLLLNIEIKGINK